MPQAESLCTVGNADLGLTRAVNIEAATISGTNSKELIVSDMRGSKLKRPQKVIVESTQPAEASDWPGFRRT